MLKKKSSVCLIALALVLMLLPSCVSGQTSNLNASSEFLAGVADELEKPVPCAEGQYFDTVYPHISQVVYDWIAQNEPI